MLHIAEALTDLKSFADVDNLRKSCEDLEDECTDATDIHACNALTKFCSDSACGTRIVSNRGEGVALAKCMSTLIRCCVKACSLSSRV